MITKLKTRLISGLTALSIFTSAIFPAVTVFSEEMPTETAVAEVVTAETTAEVTAQTETGVTEETSAENNTSAVSETTVIHGKSVPQGKTAQYETTNSTAAENGDRDVITEVDDNVGSFSYETATANIAMTVTDGIYILSDYTEPDRGSVSFFAFDINIDDYSYEMDIDSRVNVIKGYNTLFNFGTERVTAISDNVTVEYTFKDDVSDEYADSVKIYTVQNGIWAEIETAFSQCENGFIKSVTFSVTLPEFDMFAVVYTDPASVKPDEAILSSDREYYYDDGTLNVTATAFTGAVCSVDEGSEYGALPENANNISLTLDSIDEFDERFSLFDIREGENAYVYGARFYSEKYDNVNVSDYELTVVYTLSEPVPEDKAYSVMAFVPSAENMGPVAMEKITENGYIKAIKFTIKGDVFAVYENVDLITLTVAEENDYTVTVKYDRAAGIPDGAVLRVKEVLAENYIDDTVDALGWAEDDYILYTRFFDIAIEEDGVEYEPQTPVTVTVDLCDVEEAPEMLQVVHFDDEGAQEVEIGTAEQAKITFEAESFSVYGFTSALHTVLTESTDTAELAVYSALSDNGIKAVPVEIADTVEGLETEKAYEFTVNENAVIGKLWIKADIAEGAVLDERETLSLYSVYGGTARNAVIDDISEEEGLVPVGLGIKSIALIKDTGFRHLSFDVKVDGEESGKTVTFEGMMPKTSNAVATDVTGNRVAGYEQYAEDQTLLAAYDIGITENEGKYQPGEDRPIYVEITDPRITVDDIIIYHIADDGTTEEIEDFEVHEGKVCFEAVGFSVYEVVKNPSVVPYTGDSGWQKVDQDKLSEFVSLGEGVYIGHTAGYYFKNVCETTGERRGILKTSQSNTPTNDAALYYFEVAEGETDKYNIYCYDSDNNKQYVTNCLLYNNKTTYNNLLFTDKDNATKFNLTFDDKGNWKINADDDYYWNQQGGNNGKRFSSYKVKGGNDGNNYMYFWYYEPMDPDPYELDGLTYGLVYTSDGTSGVALMAGDDDTAYEQMFKLVSHSAENASVIKAFFVPKESDITEWTFENTSEDRYKLRANNGKYLTVTSTGLALTDTADDAAEFTVTPNANGQISLKSGSQYLSYSEGSGYGLTTTANNAVYLNFVEKTVLTDNDNMTYTADRISVSDGVNAHDGAEVIVYTRIWNEKELRYDFYAIDYDGTMKQCYVSGDKLMWLDDAMNTLLWKLTVYHNDDGSETGYYELQNVYSGQYLAPQLDGTLFSNSTKGILLPGRLYEENADGTKNYGEYYSDITAWDERYYGYAAIKGISTVKNGVISSVKLGTTYLYDTDKSFYFAVPDAIEEEDELHTVATVDNSLHGITMKMKDFNSVNGKNGKSDGSEVTWNYFGGNSGDTKGLLSTNLNDDGLPIVAISNDTTQVNNVFNALSDGTPVNHLFIQSIYDASGYFEFDSCQNTATLYDQDGNFKTDFTVYRELATHDVSNLNTRKHGQFFPHNNIKPGVYSVSNPENLYDSLQNLLSDSDPRKYEKLYHFTASDGTGTASDAGKYIDYYFGMEMEASFVQTPSGLDSWGHDVIFEFTGDDDFWLYVDGELVLDLGGIHVAQGGKVNFRTGEVEVQGKTTTLREVFEGNYRKRNPTATTDEVNDYLAQFFADGENIFKDYTQHTMKIFYMERGAGASNLHMRFNLSSVTEGDVFFAKSLTYNDGTAVDSNSVDLNRIQFPFQIEYKVQEEDDWKLLGQYDTSAENEYTPSVSYQNSTQTVKFASTYSSPNADKVYNNVFFLVPGRPLEIHFPDDATFYRITECAVDTSIYDVETTSESGMDTPTVVSGKIQDLITSSAQVKLQPTINFINKIDKDYIRYLDITKHLYTDKSKNSELTADKDPTEFNYRLYISNGTGEELELANLRSYYVLDPEGYLCTRDINANKFVTYEPKTLGDYVNTLSAGEKAKVTFHTSSYGAISKIPAGYTVRVPGLIAGTRFFVDERENEIPVGYDLIDYTMGMYKADDQDISATYTTIDTYTFEGESITLPDSKKNAAGIITAGSNAKMNVNNCKGYGIQASKVWSDSDFVTAHDTIYMAVYAGDDLVEGTVREFTNDDTSVKYFFDNLVTGKSISDYRICEVELVDPQIDADGNITYSNIRRLADGNITSIKVTDIGETVAAADDYTVNYSDPTATSDNGNAYTQTIRNDRKGGIEFRLFEWTDSKEKGFEYTPIAGGIFELKQGEAVLGRYTSDDTGNITVLYGFNEGEKYTLTEIQSPTGYVATKEPISFKIVKNGTAFTISDWSNANDSDDDTDVTDGRYWAEYETNVGVYTAVIDVFNPKFSLKAVKVDRDDSSALKGVHFELHRQVKTIAGNIMDTKPMVGYEDLVSNDDGVIDKIDAQIPPGVYYLVETQALSNYEQMSLEDAVQFKITDDGNVEMERADQKSYLTQLDGTYEITINVPNVRKNTDVNLTITKTVTGSFGDKTKDFTFTITVEDAQEGDTYAWTKNGEEQETPLKSGGTFTLGHNEEAVITVPVGKVITVTENAAEYTQDFKLTGDFKLVDSSDSTRFMLQGDTALAVTNTLNAAIPTGVEIPEVSAVFTGLGLLALGFILARRKLVTNDDEDDDEI